MLYFYCRNMASLLQAVLLVLFLMQTANSLANAAEDRELADLLDELDMDRITKRAERQLAGDRGVSEDEPGSLRRETDMEFPANMLDKVDHMAEERKLSGLSDIKNAIAKDDDSIPIDTLYRPIGCFSDNGGKTRPLPVLLANLRRHIDWHNLNRTIRACARLAKAKGYRYFGIQYYGECWSGPTADKSYKSDGPSQRCVVGVGKAWANFVYRFKEDECSNYTELDSARRSESYGPNKVYECDNTLTQGWYRFTGQAGTHMATKCVPRFHCGAHAPGWMSGTLPSVAEGVVGRGVCFHWRNDCCKWKTSILVRNCGGYYVYRLQSPPICRLKYCGSFAYGKKKTINSDIPDTTDLLLEPGKEMTHDITDYQDEVDPKEDTERTSSTELDMFHGNDAVLDEYEQVGCYHDKGGDNRPLPVLLANLRQNIDWKDLNKTIRACASLAQAKGYRYFGIQFWGECWSGPSAGKTYGNHGPSDGCVNGVGKAGSVFVYRFEEVEKTTVSPVTMATPSPGTPDECSNYTELDSADRAETYGPNGVYKCDNTLTQGWYRFTGQAGTHMATKCAPKFHCGAHSPGWMSGTLPSVAEGIVGRGVCFSWREDCCYWKSKVLVKNCGGFYVYAFQKPPVCRLRYCGSNQALPTARPTTPEVTTVEPSTDKPTTKRPTTFEPSTVRPTTAEPSTVRPTTAEPSTVRPTTAEPATAEVTTAKPTAEECSNYIELNSANRAANYGPTGVFKCDSTLTPGWYRFTGQAGTRMATKCVPILHCGTHSPGWMSGTLPSVAEGNVNREVCFNWREDCCRYKTSVLVKNCGGFYVYRLQKTPLCRLRYCGNNQAPQPTTEPTTSRPTTVKPTTAKMQIKTYRLCEHRSGILRCPAGERIKIRYANYGRTAGRNVCPHPSIRTMKCYSPVAANLVRCACNGHNSCPLYAKNQVYGDPCVGTFKYIEIKYQCVA